MSVGSLEWTLDVVAPQSKIRVDSTSAVDRLMSVLNRVGTLTGAEQRVHRVLEIDVVKATVHKGGQLRSYVVVKFNDLQKTWHMVVEVTDSQRKKLLQVYEQGRERVARLRDIPEEMIKVADTVVTKSVSAVVDMKQKSQPYIDASQPYVQRTVQTIGVVAGPVYTRTYPVVEPYICKVKKTPLYGYIQGFVPQSQIERWLPVVNDSLVWAGAVVAA
eukprot:Platyproteum_vivax@DN7337_c0_g1_i3.p1